MTISNSGLPHSQIRSRMASLDSIVPSTNGMTISCTGIVNVFMSMEHQAIVWCNEFVVKVSFSSLPGLIACPSSGTVHLQAITRYMRNEQDTMYLLPGTYLFQASLISLLGVLVISDKFAASGYRCHIPFFS